MSFSDNQNLISIRKWHPSDFSTIKNILLETWNHTYTFIPQEAINFHLDKFYNPSELNAMFNTKEVTGLLAIYNEKIVGFMKLFDAKSENRFYISSLYVLPEYHGRGIGKQLMFSAEQAAAKLSYNKIWVGVMKQNIISLDWYIKAGFNFIEEEPFQMGSTLVIHLIGFKNI